MHVLTSFGLKEKPCVDKHVLKYLSPASAWVEAGGCWALVASRGRGLLSFGASLQVFILKISVPGLLFDSSFKRVIFLPVYLAKMFPFFTLPLLSCAQLSFLLLCWNWLHFTEASNRGFEPINPYSVWVLIFANSPAEVIKTVYMNRIRRNSSWV